MAPASFNQTKILFNNTRSMWSITGQQLVFDGYLKVYGKTEEDENSLLPAFKLGDSFNSNEINILDKEHKKARHIVYAYKIGSLEKNYADKEPSGTTRGLIDLIHMKDKDNILVVVVRYFGGTLLGSGPLTRIYTKVASMLFIEQST